MVPEQITVGLNNSFLRESTFVETILVLSQVIVNSLFLWCSRRTLELESHKTLYCARASFAYHKTNICMFGELGV